MATNGFLGFYVETRNYGATAAFWKSLGFVNQFETGHGSGQWVHAEGGPYVFIAERGDLSEPLVTRPVLGVADAGSFAPSRPVEWLQPFEPQHWAVLEALVADPDGRSVSLQAPLPPGASAPDMGEHHDSKYH
jgi:hypothetical protein